MLKYTPQQRQEILSRLIGLSREGKINGVWNPDRTGVQVRTFGTGEPEYIPWAKAAKMTGYTEPPAQIERTKPGPKTPRPAPQKFQPTLRPQPSRRKPAPPITLEPGAERHPRSVIVLLARMWEAQS